MLPAKEVGGDFFDFFLIDRDRIGFAIGDVSGKGVPAALFMAVSRTLLRATASRGFAPDECMQQVNQTLHQESISSMFVTCFYGVLNTRIFRVRMSPGSIRNPKIERFGPKEGLPGDGGVSVHMVAGRLVFTMKHGVRGFDEMSGRFVPFPMFDVVSFGGSPEEHCVEEDRRAWKARRQHLPQHAPPFARSEGREAADGR